MRAWHDLLIELEKEGKFASNTRAFKVTNFDARNLYLEADDIFHLRWFEEHLRPILKKKFLDANQRPIKVHISTPGKAECKNNETPKKVINDHIDPMATFALFFASNKNDLLVELLKEVCQGKSSFNPMFIYGGKGVGKTHLLMATIRELQKKEQKVLFLSAESFSQNFVEGIRLGSVHEFREKCRKCDVFIIDDVQKLAKKNATQEEFFHTFNDLHSKGKQMIFASNCAPTKLSDIEERLISRFEWGIVLPVERLEKKEACELLKLRTQFFDYPLSDDVLNFLIDSFFPNIASLVRAFDMLFVRMEKNQEKSISEVQQVLQDILAKEKIEGISFEAVVKKVAAFYGLEEEDVLGRSHQREHVLPRQLSMYVCRNLLKMPFTKIGEAFKRDHSTVMSSIKNIEKLIEEKNNNVSFALNQIFKDIGY